MIIDYKVAQGESSQGLEEAIRKLLKEGYQPYGSIGVASGSMSGYFTIFQPMVKMEFEE